MLMKTICNLAFFLLPLWKVMKNVHWVCGLWMVLSGDQQWYDLESMDAAGRVPHLSPTWLPVRRCRVWVFFFFFSDFRWLGFDSRQTGLIWPELGHIGRRLKRLKQAEIGLEFSRNSRNSHLRGIVMCFLPSSFFVLWIKA